jgi:hypothetical protein
MPSSQSWLAPPAAFAIAQPESSATKMPDTIASCCNDPRRPRRWAGATSAMYVGAITEAAPMARPPTNRHSISPVTPPGNADPIADTMNTTAATCIVRGRPRRFATRPAYHAPTAQPMRAIDTTKPVCVGEVPNCATIPGTAALITEESNPNRKPPRAATAATAMTRRFPTGGVGR